MGENATSEERVRKFYEQYAVKEWERLESSPYNMLEFLTNMHFLQKYLPQKGKILDAGGGPGRYSIELARKGYEVVLLDMTSNLLDIAKQKSLEAGVADKINMIEGNITNLPFKDGEFQAVICFGPLSHLIGKKRRRGAAKELVRVLRKGGPLFVMVISYFSLLRTVAREFRQVLVDPNYEESIEKGEYEATFEGAGFTDSHFYRPAELTNLFEGLGVETWEIASCQGLGSHLKEQVGEL